MFSDEHPYATIQLSFILLFQMAHGALWEIESGLIALF
jgi:hypothetical protein